MFIAVFFTIIKMQKQPVSISGWVERENVLCTCPYTHTHSEILFSHKRKEILPFMTKEMVERKTNIVWSHVYIGYMSDKYRMTYIVWPHLYMGYMSEPIATEYKIDVWQRLESTGNESSNQGRFCKDKIILYTIQSWCHLKKQFLKCQVLNIAKLTEVSNLKKQYNRSKVKGLQVNNRN